MLMMFSLVVAVKPISQVNTGTDGLQIFYPEISIIKQNAEFKLHIHVSNISNGFPLSNTEVDCRLHLYDNSGNHTLESGVMVRDSNTYDHELFISSGNFSRLGEHSFYIWCNNSWQGGEVRGVFVVNSAGAELTEGVAITFSSFFIMLIFLFGLIMFGYYKMPGDVRDDSGFVLDVSKLAYLKPILLGLAWIVLTSIMYIAANVAVGYLTTGMFGAFLFTVWQIMFIANFIIIPLMVIFMIQRIALSKEMMGLVERGVVFK